MKRLVTIGVGAFLCNDIEKHNCTNSIILFIMFVGWGGFWVTFAALYHK
jgi:hypothetical protein